MGALFGTAGNSEAFLAAHSASAEAPAWLRSIGLDAYEYQCGKGVRVSNATALAVGRAALENGITLSLHAPYFINLANPDPERQRKTIGHVTSACRVASIMGADRVIIHTGSLMKRTRREAMEIAKEFLPRILAACEDEGYGSITLCPETMGKLGQLGNLEEVLELCSLDERLLPCVDFGHLYARTLGELNGPEAMCHILDRMESVLGAERASRFHSHFSKIEFTPKGGEFRHIRFCDPGWGPESLPLMEEVARRGWSPRFICESAGTQSEDALIMKGQYLTALDHL